VTAVCFSKNRPHMRKLSETVTGRDRQNQKRILTGGQLQNVDSVTCSIATKVGTITHLSRYRDVETPEPPPVSILLLYIPNPARVTARYVGDFTQKSDAPPQHDL
jgi:hypothetical protein